MQVSVKVAGNNCCVFSALKTKLNWLRWFLKQNKSCKRGFITTLITRGFYIYKPTISSFQRLFALTTSQTAGPISTAINLRALNSPRQEAPDSSEITQLTD